MQRRLSLCYREGRVTWEWQRAHDAIQARLLSEDYGAETQVTQQELATYVGAAREGVNRVLQDWRWPGIVDLERSRVTVKFAQRLAALGGPSQI